MRAQAFKDATGLTERQLRYWGESIDFDRDRDPRKRQGYPRNYDPDMIPVAKLLILISEKFGGYFSVDTLAKIAKNYPFGFLDLGDGIKLTWEVRYDRIDEAPEAGPRTVRQRKGLIRWRRNR